MARSSHRTLQLCHILCVASAVTHGERNILRPPSRSVPGSLLRCIPVWVGWVYASSPLLLFGVLMSTDVEGRFRALLPRPSNLSCFLPCPATDYLYPQDFGKWYRAAEALNVAGSVCMTFFLVSYVALPAEHTRRHYLNSCSIVAAMFLTVSRGC